MNKQQYRREMLTLQLIQANVLSVLADRFVLNGAGDGIVEDLDLAREEIVNVAKRCGLENVVV